MTQTVMVFALHKESQSTSQISWNKFSPTPLPRSGLIKICNKFEVCLKYTFLPISKKRASPITMSKIVPVVLSTPHIMHRITKPKPKFATSGLYPERRRSLEELEINLNLNKCSLFPWVAFTPECDISISKLFHSFLMVSVSVLKNFGMGKKCRFRFRSDFGFRHTLPSMLLCSW